MTKITEQRLSELNCNTITDREIRKLVKAYRKAKYPPVDEGWIEWKGGDCPVAIGAPIRVRHRDGAEHVDCAGGGRSNDWSHTDDPGDIIAYRIVKGAP